MNLAGAIDLFGMSDAVSGKESYRESHEKITPKSYRNVYLEFVWLAARSCLVGLVPVANSGLSAREPAGKPHDRQVNK